MRHRPFSYTTNILLLNKEEGTVKEVTVEVVGSYYPGRPAYGMNPPEDTEFDIDHVYYKGTTLEILLSDDPLRWNILVERGLRRLARLAALEDD